MVSGISEYQGTDPELLRSSLPIAHLGTDGGFGDRLIVSGGQGMVASGQVDCRSTFNQTCTLVFEWPGRMSFGLKIVMGCRSVLISRLLIPEVEMPICSFVTCCQNLSFIDLGGSEVGYQESLLKV